MKSIFLGVVCLAGFAIAVSAQPRPVESRTNPPSMTAKVSVPSSVAVEYEGGMLGFNQKEKGQLKFDEMNERLVFFGEDGKEKFSIPYDAMVVIYPQSKSVTSTTGNVVSHIPLPGASLAGFIKEKRRYLIMQIQDPDADVSGVVNFKLESKELLDSVIAAIATKAKLEQRGDAYYRPKSSKANS